MTEEGKYIYSIIKEEGDQWFGSIGINNREVNLVNYRDISAVISPTPVINFDRLNKKELTRYVACHQKVNEEIMKDYDIIPMAFGIIAPSSDEVLRILEKAYLQFKTVFKKIAGKAEFVVQVWWNPKEILKKLANTDSDIRKLKLAISSRGSILGIPMKLKLGKLARQKLEVQKRVFINDIHTFLRNSSYDSTSNKLIDNARPIGSRGDSFGEMIANFSFLIRRTRESNLDSRMQELGKKYEGKLRFKYIGPMPPYSFVNINLGLGNFEVVDKAKKLLRLGEKATFDEIKKAYYGLSHQYHPDKFQGDGEQMKKIAQAYNILENYCQSCDKFLGKTEDQKYSFREEDVKNSITIT